MKKESTIKQEGNLRYLVNTQQNSRVTTQTKSQRKKQKRSSSLMMKFIKRGVIGGGAAFSGLIGYAISAADTSEAATIIQCITC